MRTKKEAKVFCQTDFITVSDKRYSVADLKFEDIRFMYGTGRAIYISGTGRDKVYDYRNGCMTKIGDIEESEWQSLMRFLIERDGEQELFNQLFSWEKEHDFCDNDRKTLERDTLIKHSMRLFDDPKWVDFVRFNQRYRPEALEAAALIGIIADCCGCLTVQTAELVDEWPKIPCPKCGTYTTFKKKGEGDYGDLIHN